LSLKPVEATVGARVGGVEIRRARAEETSAALRLVLGTAGNPAGDERVAEFLGLAVRRRFDLSKLSVAVGGRGEILWAILPIVTPGRSALLLTPGDGSAVGRAGREVGHAAESLVGFVVGELEGVRLVQALVDSGEASAAEPLLKSGFEKLAVLIYLQKALAGGLRVRVKEGGAGEALREVRYSREHHDLFRRALVDSYHETLDCPKLTGVRPIDDVIADHQSAGEFEPGLWSVFMDGDTPAAVLLMSTALRGETMELVYLGIAPGYRRRGLGKWCVRRAMNRTVEREVGTLTLAVDAENGPALKLYHGAGMRKVHERLALVRTLRLGGE